MNHLLRERTHLTLSGAKAAVDRLLEGEEVPLEVADELLDDFVTAVRDLGAEVRIGDEVEA